MEQKTVREKVAQILTDIEKDDTYLQLALKKELDILEAKDKGFANELIYGTIKWRLRLDYVLDQFSKTPVKKMKPFVRQLMRMSVYQILFLDKVPASAAINEAVKIMHKRKMSNLSGFVNGVLRNIDRNKSEITYPNLSVYYSIPEWIITRWMKYYGEMETKAICESLSQRARVCIRINTLKTTKDKVKALLSEEGITVLEEGFLPESLYIHAPSGIHHSPSFKAGLWTVQDESAMLVGHVLGPEKGDEILDVCSAPGGKTVHLAELMQNEGHIIGADIHEHKIELIEKNAKRLGASIVEGRLQDGMLINEDWKEKFDKILLDAPCSGLGIIKRKPDIRYAKDETAIRDINNIQRKLLKNAINYLKKDGILVYSTCTLTQEENQNMVEYALSLGLQLDAIPYDMPACLKPYIKDNAYIEILPHVTDTDGFFMARFRK
ncbi:MAG: 16S rRNA (cytosine(967)-C(5))-methyltransferase RsmB [Zhenhengia sp.]|jgi:16S rRNA (cytosine967-C5)-methyltransferase|uniref:16S rRNA (cytosine(967)-C(5))-methyltransferase RsmB n=1 Tax=Zhenhengia sp. TaxID=2944208 RepID=UPI002914BEB8|nr:16S rRNA (cytosine(967)-C(5))-methyltransferase RsmB [Clostridiales bacterium]MDU6974218.1 16S rRNA (cytosine(967)-C(5))-methyltransferase RsmB [Clostridiales bacterium]